MQGAKKSLAPGLAMYQVRPPLLGAEMDPFLMIDHFFMAEPFFPPHPHAGFSAVTYMFEDSEGSFINRDSLGDRSIIGPGDLHWTQAARGVHHEEAPQERGRVCHGAQIFVNLAAKHKHEPPRAFHVTAAQMPVIADGTGTRIKVVAGSYDGHASPLDQLLTPVTMLDVQLKAGARFEHDLPPDWNVFALVVRGEGRFGAEDSAVAVSEGGAVAFADDGTKVIAEAGASGLYLLLCAAAPLNEPVFAQGPFVASNAEQMREIVAHYRAGGMGHLEASF
jgi:redox-sensitive bicupin YhaK (pirin superfamily)